MCMFLCLYVCVYLFLISSSALGKEKVQWTCPWGIWFAELEVRGTSPKLSWLLCLLPVVVKLHQTFSEQMLEFNIPKQIGGRGLWLTFQNLLSQRPLVSLSCGVLWGCGMIVISMVNSVTWRRFRVTRAVEGEPCTVIEDPPPREFCGHDSAQSTSPYFVFLIRSGQGFLFPWVVG